MNDDRNALFLKLGRIYVIPILYFSLLTIIWTWPLIREMNHSIVGQVGDNIYFIWLINWFEESLFELHQSPLFVQNLNFPEGWYLASTEITPSMVFIALPIGMIFGPTAGYNFSIFVSFVLSGLGAYVWVRALTKNSFAGIIAGTIFAFSPYRYSHYLIGHLNLLGTQWIPFYFYFLYKTLSRESGPWANPILAALFLGLIGFTSQYYLYMSLIMTVIFIIGFLLFIDRKILNNRVMRYQLLVFGSLSLILIAIAIFPYLELAKQGGLAPRSLEYIRRYSASPSDFFLPSTAHFFWGSIVGDLFDRSLWIEATLYLGFVSIGLSVVSILLRNKITIQKGIVLLFVFFGAAAFVLALGSDLHWLSEPVIIKLPGIVQSITQREQVYVPLVGRILHRWLPFYSSMRVSMRYGIFVILSVSMLAGIGVYGLRQKVKGNFREILSVVILLLVLFDFYPKRTNLAEVSGRAVDYWLADQLEPGAVVQIPFSSVEDQEQIYYTMIHGKPFLGGFFNAYPPDQYLRIRPILEQFPSEEGIQLLKELGVQFVVIDSDSYEDFPSKKKYIEEHGLLLRYSLDGDYVFEVLDRSVPE